MALTASPSTRPLVADACAGWWSQLVRFSGIGVVMTVLYLVLYQVLRPVLGDQGANLVAWVLTAVMDTSANRRLTFGIHGRAGAGRAQGQGMLVFALGLALTSGSLAVLDLTVAHPDVWLQASVQLAANGVAGLVRFLLLRGWVFRSRGAPVRA